MATKALTQMTSARDRRPPAVVLLARMADLDFAADMMDVWHDAALDGEL